MSTFACRHKSRSTHQDMMLEASSLLNSTLYLSPRIPPRFPCPGSLPPTGFTVPQLLISKGLFMAFSQLFNCPKRPVKRLPGPGPLGMLLEAFSIEFWGFFGCRRGYPPLPESRSALPDPLASAPSALMSMPWAQPLKNPSS